MQIIQPGLFFLNSKHLGDFLEWSTGRLDDDGPNQYSKHMRASNL